MDIDQAEGQWIVHTLKKIGNPIEFSGMVEDRVALELLVAKQ